MENKRFLITGGCGFIGSNIVEYLLENNAYFVRVIDNLSTGYKKNIEHLLDKYNNIEFIYDDITNIDVCRKAVIDIDIICHQAAIGSIPRSIINPLSSHLSNVDGFLNILISAKEVGIKRIVYASSSSVYGDNQILPKIEENTGNLLSPYSATKKINEIYGSVFTKCYEMECIGLRYFNVFGRRQDPNGDYAAVIPKFINLIKNGISPIINGDGNNSRDFTYIDNIIHANILAMTTLNSESFGEVFNIGVEGKTTIYELFKIIKDELKIDIEPIFGPNRIGDILHSNADISKARKILNYNPQILFKEGIIKTIYYYD